MEHPCYKCGQLLEEGKPFCPQCGAPQIRVILPEVSPNPILAGGAGVVARQPELSISSHQAAGLPTALSNEWKPCALSAAAALVLTFVGINPFVAAFAAGGLSVVFFRRGALGMPLRSGTGAKLGALTGLLLFGMSTVFEVLAITLLGKGAELRSEVLEKVHEVSDRYPSAQVQPLIDFVKTPEGFAFMLAGSIVFVLIAFIVLGTLGGATAAAITGKRSRPR
jgi:hypothetical protein